MFVIPSARICSAGRKSCWAPLTSSGTLMPLALLSSLAGVGRRWFELCLERWSGRSCAPGRALKKLVPVLTDCAFSDATLLL